MNNYTIENVLVHREPMILLDKIIKYDDKSCSCQVNITTDSLFYNPKSNGVASYIGCEYMAQTIAAYAGAIALDTDTKVKVGFLIGSRKYQTYQAFFTLGQCLLVNVKELYTESSGLNVFECEITDQQGRVLAEAKINVYQPNDPEQYLKDSLNG